MVISLLLLALLFVAGFVNVYFYFSPKNNYFYAWLQSFFPKIFSSSSAKTSSSQMISVKEKSDSNKVKLLKRVFATFDKNGDGFITKQELIESLKNIRVFMTEKEVEEIVLKVDANGDGLIDFDEFCILCQVMDAGHGRGVDDRKGTNPGEDENSSRVNGVADDYEEVEDLKEAFNVFDRDKDGLISVEELGSVLCSLGLTEGNKMEDCKAMIRKVDMDGDGMVNFDEFKRMMKSGGGRLVSLSA